MSADTNKVLETALKKAKSSPNFSKDLINYFKYLVVDSCPQGRVHELDTIFNYGKLPDLLSFGMEVVPDCSNRLTKYIETYK